MTSTEARPGAATAPLTSVTTADPTTPLTGDEYIESLRDGREVYIHGERVKDVTTHPAYRNSVRSVARLYDMMHEEGTKDDLLVPTDTGSGGQTHAFFRVARSVEDLELSRDAIGAWASNSYGWLGRSPDYKGAFLGVLGGDPEYFGEYAENARRWYRESQEKILYWNHAIVNPPIDRDRAVEQVRDVIVHVKKETDNGLIVSGAKVVATGSALTNYNFIANYPLPVKDKEFSLIATIPMDAPGMKLISRTSYEFNAATTGTPFDYPLSSRFDENDAILVLDDVLIPWENVFVYGDADQVNSFVPASGFGHRFMFQGLIRLTKKVEFITGLLLKSLEATGTKDFRGVRSRVGEVVAWRNMLRGLVDGMIHSPEVRPSGMHLPNLEYGMAARVFSTIGYPRIKEIIEQDVASGLIYLPSSALDFKSPELRPYLDRFVRGSGGIDSVDRVKLLKMLWDAVGSEFGGRHELYERNYAGNHENIRLETLANAEANGRVDEFKALADKALGEYDLDGWSVPDLIPNADVNVLLNGRSIN